MQEFISTQINKQVKEQVFFGKKIRDCYAWLEHFSEETDYYTKSQNLITDEYFKTNRFYKQYDKNISEIMKNQIALIKERNGKLYAMKVDVNDDRCIIYSVDCFNKTHVLISDRDIGLDTKIEKYSLSPDGHYIAIVTKNLWDVHYDTYLYNLDSMKLSECFKRCRQLIFYRDNRILFQIQADLNDESQTNQVVQGTIYNGEVVNKEVIFETDDVNYMEIVISGNEQYVFLNILADYYENDNVLYKKISEKYFKRLFDECSGRYAYIGGDENYHYLQTNNGSPNFKIVAVPINAPISANVFDIVKETQNRHSVKAYRSAFKVRNKLIILENALRGQLLRVFDLDSKKDSFISCGIEGVYFNNLYNLNIEDKDEVYFTYESVSSHLSLYKLDIDSLKTVKICNSKNVNDVEIKSLGCDEENVKVIRKQGAIGGKTIISFNYGYNTDLVFNSNIFNIKTPVTEWIEKGYVFVEYNISEYQIQDIETVFNKIDKLIDCLINEGISSKDHIGLFDGGFLYSTAQMYCIKRPERVSALCTIGNRTDMLKYVNDAASYMFVETLGDVTKDKKIFELMYEYSPYCNVKPDVKYPAHLLMCNDYTLLVPSYHSKKMNAVLQKYNFSRSNLLRCFNEENFVEMIIEMFAFFHKEL